MPEPENAAAKRAVASEEVVAVEADAEGRLLPVTNAARSETLQPKYSVHGVASPHFRGQVTAEVGRFA